MSLRVLLLLVFASGAAAGEVTRCRDAQGGVSYSDRPCPGATSAEAVRTQDRDALTADIAPLCGAGLDFSTDADALAALSATLAPDQAEALQSMGYALAYSRRDPPPRWHQSRRGNVHVCALGKNGDEVELIAGIDGKLIFFRNGRGERVDGRPGERDSNKRLEVLK
jgi:hypothetical protein